MESLQAEVAPFRIYTTIGACRKVAGKVRCRQRVAADLPRERRPNRSAARNGSWPDHRARAGLRRSDPGGHADAAAKAIAEAAWLEKGRAPEIPASVIAWDPASAGHLANTVAISGSVRPINLTSKRDRSSSIGGSNAKRLIRLTTFFAGEAEVRVVDPSRIRVLESIGCTVAT